MRRWRVLRATAALSLALAGCAGRAAGPKEQTQASVPFSIAVWGDTPYTPAEAAAVPVLIDQVNAANVDLTVSVGDLLGGDRCDNKVYTAAADTFNSFLQPMVYVPGDNEWTDCHRSAQDPIERLAYIRRTMFPADHSFGRHPLAVVAQRPQYPENTRWETHSVVFIGLNVPGSNDNHIADVNADEQGSPRGPGDRQAAEAEYQARDQADRDWLHQGFEAASRSRAAAVVVVMQADPGFEVPAVLRAVGHVDGFDRLLGAFATEAEAFAKPVVIIHGDSHRFRFDHPVIDPATAAPVPNVTRIETFGSPDVGWVKATFDPRGASLVSVEPHQVTPPRQN